MHTLEGLLAERLLLQAPVAVFATDLDLTIAVWTDAAERLFGHPAAEAVGRSAVELLVADANVEAAHQIAARLLRGDTWQGEFPAIHRDGGELQLLVAAGPVRDATGDVAGLIVIPLDAGGVIDQGRERRLELLVQTSELVTASLDAEAALPAVARLAVAWLSDLCIVDLVTAEGDFERVALAHALPERQADAERLRAFPPSPEAPHIQAIVAEARAQLVPDLTERVLADLLRGPEHAATVRSLDLGSAMLVPLAARGAVMGIMTMAASRTRTAFAPQDVLIAEDVARRVAMALDNSRLRRNAEEAVRRAQSLQLISDAALSHLGMEQLLPEVLERVHAELRTDTAAVLLADEAGETLRLRASLGFERGSQAVLIPVGEGVAGRVAKADGPVVFSGLAASDFANPALRANPVRTVLGAPLRVGGRMVGVIQVGTASARLFTPAELELVRLAADRIALAVEHARLFEAESAARDRLALLAEASAILGEGLDYRGALERLAGLVVPRLGDWCAIELLSDPPEATVVAHAVPAKARMARELMERYPPDPAAEVGAPAVARTGEAELHETIDDAMLVAGAKDAEHLELLRSLDLRSALVVPLRARDRILGTMTVIAAESGRRYTRTDLGFVAELARRAATAVDTARLFQDRDQVARTLQRSLLPPVLPEIPNVEVAAVFRPTGEGGEIGGDFYDVFESGEGVWTFAVGDVCGKGTAAAAITGLARHTLRAASSSAASPADVLRVLNRALLRQVREDTFCTVALATLAVDGGIVRMTAAAGGHPPALVVGADGAVSEATAPGTLLGVYDDVAVSDRVRVVAPGECVVFYTDGVIEARREGETFGERRLHDLLRECAGMSAAGIAERIERAALEFGPPAPRDDIAILVARVS